jgi:hypothetical protein
MYEKFNHALGLVLDLMPDHVILLMAPLIIFSAICAEYGESVAPILASPFMQ